MPQGYPRPGELYLHFKNKLYQIVTTATHSETQEPLVIYQALYEPFQTYARPLSLFTSPVDKEKYPDATQYYRFQLVSPPPSEGIANAGAQPLSGGGPTEGLANALADKKSLSAEEKLMAFFDAESMEEKYKILLDMRTDITDRMINNMAVVLDVVIDEGPLDRRYEELKTCVRTFRKYETSRLR